MIQYSIEVSNGNNLTTLTIENTEYYFHFYWSTRGGWYFSIYNPATSYGDFTPNADNLIYGGRKIIPNQDLLSLIPRDNLPTDGTLMCLDTTSTGEQLTELSFDDFGGSNRYQLFYITTDDMEEFLEEVDND